jgi:hypothetical protein
MLLRHVSLLLLLFSVKAYAYEFPVEIFEYIDDTRVVAFIAQEDINESRRWQPFKEALPLAIDEAVKAVKQHIDADPRLSNIALLEVELRQIPRFEQHWHYLVKVKADIEGERRNQYFVVLMNGKIIPAIREPQSTK